MTSILDIGPLTEEVEIRGVKLAVQGLTAGHLFELFTKFPDMRKVFNARNENPQAVLMGLAPDLIVRVISLALGEADNAEVEAKIKTMGVADQFAIIAAVFRLSFPDGVVPFVNQVTKLLTSTTSELSGVGLKSSTNATTKSPAPFNAALQTDTLSLARGRAPRAN